MINLLPPLYKRRIKQEQYFRIIVILGIAVLGALISLLLLLTAIRLYVAGLVTTEDPFLSTTQTSGAAQEFEQAKRSIQQHNAFIAQVSRFYQNQTDILAIIQELSDDIPSDITLTSLSYTASVATKEKPEPAKISITGFSPNRELLSELRASLQENPLFENLQMPLTNLTNLPVNFLFSAQLTVTQ